MDEVIELKSKGLTQYITFLKRLKSLGNDFLVKGNMWVPCIKTDNNFPGTHIGKDPLLSKICEMHNAYDIKFRCSQLEAILQDIDTVKGKKYKILFSVCDNMIKLIVNDTEWVIASEWTKDTVDHCFKYSHFEDILTYYSGWETFTSESLQQIHEGHPVTIYGKMGSADHTSIVPIRLAKNRMKLRGTSTKMDYTGEYVLAPPSSMFDDNVVQLIIHMKYKNIECINMYHIHVY